MGTWRLRAWYGLAAALALCALLATPAVRESALRALGTALVVNDPLQRVDAIAVTLDADVAGALEAADLVKAGIAAQVILFDEQLRPAEREVARRGLVPRTRTSEQAAVLAGLGVVNVTRMPDLSASSGTRADAQALAAWCRANALRSVLVVTTADHSRRVRRVMARALEPIGTQAAVRPATHGDFDPATWWHTTDGRRIVVIEWQKLILDLVSHPF